MQAEAVQLAPGKEKGTDPIGVAGGGPVVRGLWTGLLNAPQASVGIDMLQDAGPGFLEDRSVGAGVE